MKSSKEIITVIGLGYIGLPTAALLANKGYRVNGIDLNIGIVETVNRGEIHIIESDLKEYVSSAVSKGNLKAFNKIKAADIFMICVPTPLFDNEIPTPNIDFVIEATKSISKVIKDGDLVILESTSPPGTTEVVGDVLKSSGIDITKIFITYCPERVLPGNILEELTTNPRVVGGLTEESSKKAAKFYSSFVTGEILVTDANTAEMCKLVENSFRDLNIAFANELSIICESLNVDVWELIRLANHHPRVNILQPGSGVGGHCIAVDPWFLASADPKNSKMIKTARETNNNKPLWVTNKIISIANISKSKKIACLGLSFKPNIDDLRESPAVKIVKNLIREGYEVGCVEPNIESHSEFCIINLHDALNDFDLIAILVGHKEFTSEDITYRLKLKNSIDFCGILQNKKND